MKNIWFLLPYSVCQNSYFACNRNAKIEKYAEMAMWIGFFEGAMYHHCSIFFDYLDKWNASNPEGNQDLTAESRATIADIIY